MKEIETKIVVNLWMSYRMEIVEILDLQNIIY